MCACGVRPSVCESPGVGGGGPRRRGRGGAVARVPSRSPGLRPRPVSPPAAPPRALPSASRDPVGGSAASSGGASGHCHGVLSLSLLSSLRLEPRLPRRGAEGHWPGLRSCWRRRLPPLSSLSHPPPVRCPPRGGRASSEPGAGRLAPPARLAPID